MSEADLGWANFGGADLSKANLRGAYLRFANLSSYLCEAFYVAAEVAEGHRFRSI